MANIEIDAIDRRILAILQENGRLSNQEIAERINLSPSPCLRRIRRLEESGVIRGYVALLDAQRLGLDLLAYVNVRLEKRGGPALSPRGDATARRSVSRGRPDVAGSGGVSCDDRRDGLPVARPGGGHGAFFALCAGPVAAPSVGDRRENELLTAKRSRRRRRCRFCERDGWRATAQANKKGSHRAALCCLPKRKPLRLRRPSA